VVPIRGGRGRPHTCLGQFSDLRPPSNSVNVTGACKTSTGITFVALDIVDSCREKRREQSEMARRTWFSWTRFSKTLKNSILKFWKFWSKPCKHVHTYYLDNHSYKFLRKNRLYGLHKKEKIKFYSLTITVLPITNEKCFWSPSSLELFILKIQKMTFWSFDFFGKICTCR
jgi:hypothetical protein